jgi:hypothetical protein
VNRWLVAAVVSALIGLFAPSALAAARQLRFGSTLRLTDEYMRTWVLQAGDGDGKQGRARFLIARSDGGACPKSGEVLAHVDWRDGAPLELPARLRTTKGRVGIFVENAAPCAFRGWLNYDPREVTVEFESDRGNLHYRIDVADILSNVVRIPYFDELAAGSAVLACRLSLSPDAEQPAASVMMPCSRLSSGPGDRK